MDTALLRNTEHTEEAYGTRLTKKELELIEEFNGTVTKCPTAYNRESKQATFKQGYGEQMTTAYTPITVESNEDGLIADYDLTIEWRSYGYEEAMIKADKELYRLLMRQDDKFIRVLQRVRKHIKRKARASANKNNKSKNGVTKRKAYIKRDRPVLPTKGIQC